MLLHASDLLKKTAHVTSESIGDVKTAVDTITDGAMTQAEDVQEASDLISQIANQTMLLALNASIEVSRALRARQRSFADIETSADDLRSTATTLAENISRFEM